MLRVNDFDPENFHFRGLHPRVILGTASDRYAGWIGQVYSEDRYRDRLTTRSKKLGKASFREQVLPVESVEEYFEHFRVLEVDYTFYQFLLDRSGEPTQTFHVLKKYKEHLASDDTLLLKAPQAVFARKIRRGGSFIENEDYLDPEIFIRQFHDPVRDILGSHLGGVVFEQEYQRKEERIPVEELATALDRFLGAIPRDDRYHVELRTESYLSEPLFEVLKKYGVGQVFSHWTWLPTLEKQFEKAGRQFFNSGKKAVIRLMTPIGTRYEDAYARAYPFNKLVDGMLQPKMLEDTVSLVEEGIRRETEMNVIVNNRAGGNAPLIVREIAKLFLSRQSVRA